MAWFPLNFLGTASFIGIWRFGAFSSYTSCEFCYRDEWCDDGMDVAFAQAAQDRYSCDSIDLYRISITAK